LSGNIKILSQALSNKIAAGEVVSRPESVVKELIENSIDSGAGDITLIIKDAGKSLIQVIDDGSGMNEDDAVMCFQRHSTSKIASYEDLENISTLGFRGEALASICSISQVELKTKKQDEEIGTLVRIDGNEIKEVTKTNCDKGTSVSIRNIFYNTPGRRNFLKSNQTEFRHIYETFVRLAISHPDIKFSFINNDDNIFKLDRTSLQLRIQSIFTKQYTSGLLPINEENQIIKLNGLISKPSFAKKTRHEQYFYLNGRFFTNRNLSYSVSVAYDDLIEKGNYPSFFIFIEIDPKKVDVNVHPSKLEVKFEDESAVFGFLRSGIRNALRNSDLVFDVQFKGGLEFQGKSEPLEHTPVHFENPVKNKPDFKSGKYSIHDITEASFNPDGSSVESLPVFDNDTNQTEIFEHTRKEESEAFNVWQYQNKYVMCQTETGLMILDQHAAHERILYEKAVMLLNSHSGFSQQLLIPIRINLSKIDFQLVKMLEEELNCLGFNFLYKKDEVIEITGLPSDVKIGDENKIFQELIDQYKEYDLKLKLDKRDNMAKSFACKGAIKSGDRISKQEMLTLIDDLFAAQMPYVCPHGRPTVIRITTDELDKRFSRT